MWAFLVSSHRTHAYKLPNGCLDKISGTVGVGSISYFVVFFFFPRKKPILLNLSMELIGDLH